MPTASFDESLPFVLRWEGGYVDHPADPGGATNRGITQKTYDAWRARNGQAHQDVRDIDDAQVRAVYESAYWRPARCQDLPRRLDLVHFDTAVNMGPGRAVRFLQAALGATVDGDFGPGTERALQARQDDPAATLKAYCDARESYYRRLVEQNAKLQVFLKGWLNRLNALRKEVGMPGLEADVPLDFGDADHIERVPDELEDDPIKPLLERSASALRKLSRLCTDDELAAIKPLVVELRNRQQYPQMLQLAEAVHRRDPQDAANRRLHAQALIETGQVTVAIDVLQALGRSLAADHPEQLEVQGLLGRAWKQIFFDSGEKSTTQARQSLAASIEAYRRPYEHDTNNTWHGVNLLALLSRARRDGLAVAPDIQVKPLAKQLLATLSRVAPSRRDEWYLPTVAEASLGLDDWDVVEHHLRQYVADADVPAFLIASTLRQFRDIWEVETIDDRGRGLVQLLCARLMRSTSSELKLDAAQTIRLQKTPSNPGQAEAVLGTEGPRTARWWNAGVQRSRSVGAVKRRLGNRIGTCFLVRAGDFGLAPADELLALTNFHVVNEQGVSPGIRPGDAEIVFEAAENSPVYQVQGIVWSAPVERQDASLLRLTPQPKDIEPVPIAARLPDWPLPSGSNAAIPRVYLIGHPAGGELSFSFQDNELLGHEGPPAGTPPVEGVCRVHYRAPTEGGSSGSPVFEGRLWQAIALHHMGGKGGMSRLNGEDGSYAANEGISIGCIVEAIKSDL